MRLLLIMLFMLECVKMKKSKYAKNIKISKDVYAIFNNLVMKSFFLNKNYFNYFKNNEFD